MNLKYYNPKWAKLFEKEKESLKTIFGNKTIDIQRIGSTVIPQIQSKPIIDIAILIRSYKTANTFIDKLGIFC